VTGDGLFQELEAALRRRFLEAVVPEHHQSLGFVQSNCQDLVGEPLRLLDSATLQADACAPSPRHS
jgi:hypothetical protein